NFTNRRTGFFVGRPVKIRIQDPATATWYTQFVGRIESANVDTGTHGPRRCHITGVGWMAEASNWNVTGVTEQINKRGDEILTALLAQMP
ncbi:hypothetical protein OFL77_27065, partial [Escherichia coli]|uniref:hypothetical protein n=1 Tax=Escherichia coli TaxID=562 RepID=UPI0021E0E6A0